MMSQLGRNDKCHCGSGKKYKKCCMDQDQEKEKPIQSHSTLKKAFDVKVGDDFFHRYIFGLNHMRDVICPREKRLEYDNSFAPVFQNLLEAKYAKDYVLRLIEKHNKEIEEGKDGLLQGHQLNIHHPIDNELNMFFKDVFIRGTIAIDCLIDHTEYMGYGISFLFSDHEKKYKKGIKDFPIPETDDRFTRLRDMVHQNKQTWYTQFKEMRRQIEHFGYKLPDIKHTIVNGKVMPIYPTINGQTIEQIVSICWENLSNLCEEIVVYLISLQLPDYLTVVMFSPEQRDPMMPLRFAVRHKAFPNADYSHS